MDEEERICWRGGAWLKEQRRQRSNMSLERLAGQMKMSRSSLVHLERDESDPAYSTLVKLGRALGLSTEEVAAAGQGGRTLPPAAEAVSSE